MSNYENFALYYLEDNQLISSEIGFDVTNIELILKQESQEYYLDNSVPKINIRFYNSEVFLCINGTVEEMINKINSKNKEQLDYIKKNNKE